MKNRFLGLSVAAGTAAAVLWIAQLPASGQAKGVAFSVGKTWFNQPDLMGIWQPPPKAGDNIEKGGFIKDPSNGKIPYLPAAVAKRNENGKNAKALDLVNKCYMPGVPRLMYMGYPFQIFENEKYIAIVSEYAHVYRMIYLDGSPHIDGLDFWLGDSRGHWEGDSLVVDITNFNDQTWFDKAGNYHSDQLHVTEKYTRTSPTTLLYEATMHDPKTFSKDWKISIPMTQKTGPTARILEYECQDLVYGGK
ncbi:MAG: hypothetical protein JO307_21235 [Bryobacterales bacterium]|nr:hypothetical protein [Bryobacterales bacterium]MBV9396855.1 hypothetical protein [Bryobacterales bacterium]